MSRASLVRPLVVVVGLLLIFCVLMVYSAGQTDVPTAASGAWRRQLVWCGAGLAAMWVASRTSPRLLEWGAPALYIVSVGLLVLTGTWERLLQPLQRTLADLEWPPV